MIITIKEGEPMIDKSQIVKKNKTIYENYYLGHNKKLWDKFELKILVNNRKIKKLLKNSNGYGKIALLCETAVLPFLKSPDSSVGRAED